MSTSADPLSLARWRRRVAEIYAEVRHTSQTDPGRAWCLFRDARDELFGSHPQSPLDVEARARFSGLPYFAYDPAWRVRGKIDTDVTPETLHLHLTADGDFFFTRVARIHFTVCGEGTQLSLFWVEGYGGGLFLPFKDMTNGRETFGGGRYLYDTIKGADLGAGVGEIMLDFNYAYNPSCAYNSRWICPLSPMENRLPFAVAAGEMKFTQMD